MSRYSLYFNEAVAGQIYQADPRDIMSLPAVVIRSSNSIYGPITFGCPLSFIEVTVVGSTEELKGVYITSSEDVTGGPDVFIGISVVSNTCEIEDSNLSETLDFGAAYFDKDVVSVLTKGKIWVKISDGVNVKAGEKAYVFNYPSSVSTALTEFTNEATTTFINPPETVNNIEIGLFVTDKNEQNLAVLQFDLSANQVIL